MGIKSSEETWSELNERDALEGGRARFGNLRFNGADYRPKELIVQNLHIKKGCLRPGLTKAEGVLIEASYEGEMVADEVTIENGGIFTGFLKTAGKVVLQKGAIFRGKLKSGGVTTLAEGCAFEGSLEAPVVKYHAGASLVSKELKTNNLQADLPKKFEGTLNIQPKKAPVQLVGESAQKDRVRSKLPEASKSKK